MTQMINVELICVIAGLVITPLVSMFKRWQFTANHPKIVAFVFSTIVGAGSAFTFGDTGWQAIVACTLIPFATAVTTYEVQKSAANDAKAAG